MDLRFFRHIPWGLSVLVILLFTGAPVMAEDASLDRVLEKMVKAVSEFLRSEGHDSITLGQFQGPPQLGATAGAGIVKKLTTLIAKPEHGITVKPIGAPISLHGRYVAKENPATGGLSVSLSGTLETSFGDVVQNFTINDSARQDGLAVKQGKLQAEVKKEEDVVRLLGITTSLDSQDQNPDDRSGDLLDAVKDSLNPKAPLGFTVDDNGVVCRPQGSPYGIELIVGKAVTDDGRLTDGTSRPVKTLGKFPFVEIQRGEIYLVKLHNDSEHEAAVQLSVDGLSVFDFSELKNADGTPKYTYYFVPANSSIVVRGWHRDNTKVSAFQVTSYAESGAGTLDQKESVGTVTALFSASWPKGQTPPPDESRDPERGLPDATGFGPTGKQSAREVQRDVGKLRASISVRYTRSDEP